MASAPPGVPLSSSFYDRNTCVVAKELLGHYVCRLEEAGDWTWGKIVETEAYVGEDDPACHASSGKTARNGVMYGIPGKGYVYFTYGMHYLLNAVTEREGFPAAVLIRALEPLGGIGSMRRRRGLDMKTRQLLSGPARLCQGLGIDLSWNNCSLTDGRLLICQGSTGPGHVAQGPRIGIRVGLEKDWRFWDADSVYVSRR